MMASISVKLSRRQFDILSTLARADASQRELAKACKSSLGTVNKEMASLAELGLLDGGKITKRGFEALEPYRVKRAVFLAAGFGSRLVPITLNTPKPLVRVHGVRIIDHMIDALLAAGIDEIYIVRGYLAEQFDFLLRKYPMIRFIENPAYNDANNISSAECARFLFEGAYVLEADLLLYNADLITPYQYSSNYLGIPVERTDDWCVSSDGGRITGVQVGGVDCHQMVGISYWDSADGIRLANHIDDVYRSPGGKERYWDEVALKYHIDDYDISIRECSSDDVIEIDTFSELKEIDRAYAV